MKWVVFSSIFILLLIQTEKSFSYPQNYRLGYVSCVACHTTPQGSGKLTPYGQSVADSMAIFSKEDEKTESEKLKNKFQPGAQLRAMAVDSKSKTSVFPMQMDALAYQDLNSRAHFDTAFGIHGKKPVATSLPKDKFVDRLVVRKFLFGYRPKEGIEWSIGRDMITMGIPSDDHTLYLRTRQRRGVLDYVSKLQADLWSDSGLSSYFLFAPSMEELKKNQEWGGGARIEQQFIEQMTLGGLAMIGQSPSILRTQGSIFSRVSFSPWHVFLIENSWTYRKLRNTQGNHFNQNITYLKLSLFPEEWLECSYLLERIYTQIPFQEIRTQWGPQLQLRVLGNLSLIFDYRTSTLRGGSREDLISGQIYAHL